MRQITIIFFVLSCPVRTPFWLGVHRVLKIVFATKLTVTFKLLFLSDHKEMGKVNKDKYLQRVFITG